MFFISTKDQYEKVSFKEAVVKGLAKNKALFVPEVIPQLAPSFFDGISDMSDSDIAFEVLYPFVNESIEADDLKQIIAETLSFPTPVASVTGNVYALELFHGPTQAFKDVGVRFMSRFLSHFIENDSVTVLVATSGDTGSAVANGFYDVDGLEVVILFPKGKVSQYQEYQMTSLGKNIKAVEVDGTFDDCQKLVKQVFNDDYLNKKINLSSANSINIARLLPQMLYYFFAYKQVRKTTNKPLVISVPSGNFGNLTAGIMAKKMGLPIERFIAANNANDTFPKYLNSGDYLPRPSVTTYSNAMDVGEPSNFERLMHIYNNDLEKVRADIRSYSISDAETLHEMAKVYRENGYVLDPHGAVGKICLEKSLSDNEIGLFLETAHPGKFEAVVRKAVSGYPQNSVDMKKCSKVSMNNTFEALKSLLLDR